MLKLLSIIVAAAVIAAAIVTLPGASGAVSASTPVPHAKSDRLDARPTGWNCSQRAWPHFDRGCLRDRKAPLVDARSVRVVTVDRLR
jgi:hypothetical protein